MKRKKLSGIYQIINKINGKRYIGSSKDLCKRETDHFRLLKLGNHHSRYFQFAYNKYGMENFEFQIILYCNKSKLLYYEQLELNKYSKDEIYNTCRIAGSTLGMKHSEEARAAKSIRQTGKLLSEKTKEKIRKSMIGVRHTAKRRMNLSIAHVGKMTGWDHPGIRPVIQINKNNNKIINLFASSVSAKNELLKNGIAISSPNIRKVCANCYGRNTAGGFKWRFATQKEIKRYKKEKNL